MSANECGFRFKRPVRCHVRNLLGLMAYANSRPEGRWQHQHNGVYGGAYAALRLIIIETVGGKVYDRLELLGHYVGLGVEELEQGIYDAQAELHVEERDAEGPPPGYAGPAPEGVN